MIPFDRNSAPLYELRPDALLDNRISNAKNRRVHLSGDPVGERFIHNYRGGSQNGVPCPMCNYHRVKFFCSDCIRNGDFTHSTQNVLERFAEKKLKFYTLKGQINRMTTDLKQRQAAVTEKENLLMNIRHMENSVAILKRMQKVKGQKLEETNNLLDDVKRKVLKSHDKQFKLKKGIAEVKNIIAKQNVTISMKSKESLSMEIELQTLIRSRIAAVTTFIFKIEQLDRPAMAMADKLNDPGSLTSLGSKDSLSISSSGLVLSSVDKSDVDEDTPLLLLSDNFSGNVSTTVVKCSPLSTSPSASGSNEVLYFRIGEPWLASNENFGSFFSQESPRLESLDHSTETNFRCSQYRMLSSLSYLCHVSNLIALFSNLILPQRVIFSDFYGKNIHRDELFSLVAKVCTNIVYLALAYHVDCEHIRPRDMFHNLVLLLCNKSSISIMNRRIEIPPSFCDELRASLLEDLYLVKRDFLAFHDAQDEPEYDFVENNIPDLNFSSPSADQMAEASPSVETVADESDKQPGKPGGSGRDKKNGVVKVFQTTRYCSVPGCLNDSASNSDLVFALFPDQKRQPERRKKWIEFCKKTNKDGSEWSPKPASRICSAHFEGRRIDNKTPEHPSYLPTIRDGCQSSTKSVLIQEFLRKNRHQNAKNNRAIPWITANTEIAKRVYKPPPPPKPVEEVKRIDLDESELEPSSITLDPSICFDFPLSSSLDLSTSMISLPDELPAPEPGIRSIPPRFPDIVLPKRKIILKNVKYVRPTPRVRNRKPVYREKSKHRSWSNQTEESVKANVPGNLKMCFVDSVDEKNKATQVSTEETEIVKVSKSSEETLTDKFFENRSSREMILIPDGIVATIMDAIKGDYVPQTHSLKMLLFLLLHKIRWNVPIHSMAEQFKIYRTTLNSNFVGILKQICECSRGEVVWYEDNEGPEGDEKDGEKGGDNNNDTGNTSNAGTQTVEKNNDEANDAENNNVDDNNDDENEDGNGSGEVRVWKCIVDCIELRIPNEKREKGSRKAEEPGESFKFVIEIKYNLILKISPLSGSEEESKLPIFNLTPSGINISEGSKKVDRHGRIRNPGNRMVRRLFKRLEGFRILSGGPDAAFYEHYDKIVHLIAVIMNLEILGRSRYSGIDVISKKPPTETKKKPKPKKKSPKKKATPKKAKGKKRKIEESDEDTEDEEDNNNNIVDENMEETVPKTTITVLDEDEDNRTDVIEVEDSENNDTISQQCDNANFQFNNHHNSQIGPGSGQFIGGNMQNVTGNTRNPGQNQGNDSEDYVTQFFYGPNDNPSTSSMNAPGSSNANYRMGNPQPIVGNPHPTVGNQYTMMVNNPMAGTTQYPGANPYYRYSNQVNSHSFRMNNLNNTINNIVNNNMNSLNNINGVNHLNNSVDNYTVNQVGDFSYDILPRRNR